MFNEEDEEHFEGGLTPAGRRPTGLSSFPPSQATMGEPGSRNMPYAIIVLVPTASSKHELPAGWLAAGCARGDPRDLAVCCLLLSSAFNVNVSWLHFIFSRHTDRKQQWR